jgi:tetratricopeptide (TPR) repeat protein
VTFKFSKIRSAVCLSCFACALAFAQDDLQAKAQQAKQAMIASRYEEAARLYAELVRELPENPGMLMNLGLAQHSAGHYREAVASFASALKLKPDLVQAEFLLGMTYQKLGEPELAIRPLQDAVDADAGNRLARFELADALLSTGRFQDSALHFQKLTELDPNDARCWQGLGISYLGLARRAFETIEKAAPNSGYLEALLADSLVQRHQDRSAFACYRKALRAWPTLPGLHAALAGIYRRSEHPDWAAVEEQRERALAPPDCAALRAQCAFFAGHHAAVIRMANNPLNLYWKSRSYGELARAALARLGELPPSPAVYELIAESYREQGKHAEAVQELGNALKLDPANSRIQELLAAELWRSHDFEAAKPAFEKLLAANPNSAELNYELGDLLLERQQSEKALPLLEKAVRLKPGLLPAQASLARALVECGHYDTALGHFQAALPIDEDGQIHFQLSRAAQYAGKPELAAKALRQYQVLSRGSAKNKVVEGDQQIGPPD